VQTLNADEADDLSVDLDNLEARLQQEKGTGRGVIVSYGLGEVNTGGFGSGLQEIAALCKQYGAWLHVDAGEYGVCLSRTDS
jgi:glutamate/tyrosine decarboxylase-like PLP-dependent enzyme